jgi:hypothetical protein
LKNDHRNYISSLIRAGLDELDAGAGDETYEDSQSDGQLPELRGKLLHDGHVTLRSQQPQVRLASFGDDSFHTRLSVWLAKELGNLNISLPCAVDFGPGDLVSDLHACYPPSLTLSRLPSTDPSRLPTSPRSTSINMLASFIAAPSSTTKSDVTL